LSGGAIKRPAKHFGEDWSYGQHVCDMFTSLDVMLCTASILNLCAISIDRSVSHHRQHQQPHLRGTCLMYYDTPPPLPAEKGNWTMTAESSINTCA